MKPYLEKTSSVLNEFNTNAKGLSQEEAKKRLLSDGPNKLAEGKKESLVKKFLEQLSEPMLIILMVAAVLSVGTSYLSGEPEVFRRDEYGDRKPVIPVYANFGMSCRISTDIIKNRGCAIVSLCDELCRRGFIVDLHLVEAVYYNRKKWMTNIAVRLDPLDLDTVAFIIANPLCLRRLWFAAFERYTGEACPFGHGSAAEYVLDEIFESGLSGFYFVSSSHICFDEDNFRSLEKAKNHIMSMVEKFKESAEQVILG